MVISVPERQQGEPFASITAAVKGLTDDFGLKVIVDRSSNSIAPELNTTGRQVTVCVDLMSQEMIESISEFDKLVKFMKKNDLDKVIWEVFGGCPLYYYKLNLYYCKISHYETTKIIELFKVYTQSYLSDCLNIILKSSVNTDLIIQKFRENNVQRMSFSQLKSYGLSMDSPNKVFKEIKMNNHTFIVPSDDEIENLLKTLFTKNSDINKN